MDPTQLLFDCDNHCYEPRDAFTRHMPKSRMGQAIAPVRLPDGREVILCGDRVAVFVSEQPDYDLAYRPGSLKEMLRQMASGNPEETYQFEPMRPEFVQREARLRVMDEQGVTRTILYPGSGALSVEEYIRDTDAAYANIHSFNLWFDETWGFNHQDRIYAPALMSLRDVDKAVEELEFVLARGARFLMIPTGPAHGRSPGDPHFDPFWARVNEAGANVAYHLMEHWFNANIAPAWGHNPVPSSWHMSAWQWLNTYGDYPTTATLSALIFDNLFGRFPNIQVVVSECGAEWVPTLVHRMDKARGMGRNGPWKGGALKERPSEIFRRHVKVAPYPEDNITAIVDQLGHSDCLVMGSDYPHAEGLAEPRQFADLLCDLPAADQPRILYDNAQYLVSR